MTRKQEILRETIRAVLFFVLLAITLCTMATLQPATREIIGVTNSNPGNIRSHNWHWWRKHGAVGVDPWKHLIFATDEDGMKALRYVLKGYQRKGFRTIERITARWVGPSHSTAAIRGRNGYMQRLTQETGLLPDDEVDMDDPWTLAVLAHAIVWAENGANPYPASLYQRVFGY